jgi:hypothetical protein
MMKVFPDGVQSIHVVCVLVFVPIASGFEMFMTNKNRRKYILHPDFN